ncbi:MAG: hypothetical protein HZA01_12495 [Nitrospinae bacterium]|nr:hypothetical protein [Nitrospinota bacterium]
MKVSGAGPKVTSGASASRPMPQSKPPAGGQAAGGSSAASSVHALKAAMAGQGKGTKVNIVA